MTQAAEIFPLMTRIYLSVLYMVNIMGVDVLVMQGARVSATMIFAAEKFGPCTLRVLFMPGLLQNNAFNQLIFELT